jgi:ABC-type multidrug transport system, ATPase component
MARSVAPATLLSRRLEEKTMAEVLLEAHGLSRRYGATLAVDGVDLELRRGEIVGLLGPNGAGKTSTMHMISGCLAPSSGSVRINGFDLAEAPKKAKAGLGYLPEQPPLYPELSVIEFLRYTAGLRGVPKARRAAAVDHVLDACGLADRAQRLIGNLSKGYQQRVGLAQAIIHQPAVVILDEPTVGLDPIQIREIRDLIRSLGREHAVLLSSHILPEIQATCDRVMVIHHGRLVYSDRVGDEADGGLLLRLARPPEPAALAALPGVTAVESEADGGFRLLTDGDHREAIADAVVRGGWGLVELRPHTRTLEEIFVKLTSGDLPAQREAA